ncbi:MAG: prepilin-type N-terminal cleavage/methylation domain-containing protein [Chloroflexi bacterium]|nr:prepilin-type N-terminal cleavage/methylation domain-containing protein [Chloroflexota bacterium]
MRKLIRSQKGFTLIELLVVIGILATLAGVVTIGVTQFVNRGGTEANCTELHNVQTAATACIVEVATGNLAPGTDCTDTAVLRTNNLLLTDTRCTTYAISSDGIVTAQSGCVTGVSCTSP